MRKRKSSPEGRVKRSRRGAAGGGVREEPSAPARAGLAADEAPASLTLSCRSDRGGCAAIVVM